jgi:hypothetical protein
VLPIQWCSNLVELQDFLGFKIARHIFLVHAHSLAMGFKSSTTKKRDFLEVP